MKMIKKLIGLCAALCLLLSVLPAARAEDAQPAGDERFEGKTWEQITDAFIEEHHANTDGVTIGYCNTVTEEEHYYRGEQYMVSGSLFKVPLNMVFCERIANGDMDWSTKISGYTYEYLLKGTIIDSNNEQAEILWREVGIRQNRPYRYYREVIAPYMGVDPENVDDMYYKNNYFTAEQMIHCLKLLYDNPDRFPRLIDTMKQAEPKNYFLLHPQSVEVAHKYGYFAEGSTLYLNDCGFCFTEDPFCLVVFTEGIMHPYEFLTEYCTLMIDYTEYQTKLRHEEEQRERREAAIQALNPAETAAAVPTGNQQEIAETTAVPAEDAEPVNLRTPLLAVLVLFITGSALVGVLKLNRKRQLKLGWALPALLLASLALFLCVLAPGMKTAVSSSSDTAEDPQKTVEAFFDGLVSKNYGRAYGLLYNYASLGLEDEPDSEAARLMADALRSSYAYSLYGECRTEDLHAWQQVILEVLDLSALQEDLKAGTEEAVQKMSEELSEKELLDENGNYLPAVTEKAYLDTLRSLLSHPDRYRTSIGLNIELYYTVDGWRVVGDNPLIFALSGRTAYTRGGKSA